MIASGCQDRWEEHNEVNNPNLKESLTARISSEAQLSTFSELLVKSGYDTVLASSRNFTVWAPSNDVLAGLDPAIVADPLLLRSFVGNHITYSSYLTNKPQPFLQLRTLNGKNVRFTSTSVEDIAITKADQYVSNGVLHIINGIIQPKKNIYEFLLSEASGAEQRNFILSLNQNVFDPSNAEIIGTDPVTGRPVYKPGTDSIVVNPYLNFARINNEDSLYTYVILKDNAFLAEEDKLERYFTTNPGPVDTTKMLTRRNIINDLAFSGFYAPGNLPDSLTSINNVKVHLDPAAIVSTHTVSNGIVYIMDRIDYKTANKLKTIIIEGESARTLSASGISNYTTTRRNPDFITNYTQIRGDNFSAARSWYRYTPTLHSVTYNVYWRAVRDFSLAPNATTGVPPVPFQQRIAFKKFDATELDYKFVDYKEKLPAPATGPRVFEPIYEDVYIGQYTVSNYGREHVFIVSNTVNTAGLNSIVLDYIKLVPAIN